MKTVAKTAVVPCAPAACLQDRSVVVMGAGSIAPGWSNGKACAVSYARAGANVVCVDIVAARAEEAAHRIAQDGCRVIALKADVTSEDDVKAVVERAEREFGRLDVMHNNVGVGGSFGTPDQIPLAAWERELAVNLTTAYLGTRHAVPAMRRAGGGVIINISSLLATRFLRMPSVAYTAAKAGIEAMTRACAWPTAATTSASTAYGSVFPRHRWWSWAWLRAALPASAGNRN